MKTVWSIADMDRVRAGALARALEISPLLAHLLLLRDVDSEAAARDFLSPCIVPLRSPFELTDVEVAVTRLEKARHDQESIMVFGDYDVDGISGTALLVQGLRRFGFMRVAYTVPHRFDDGYGIDPKHVTEAAENGVSLILTVDNGIKAYEAATEAKRCGIDMIITDHHSIEGDVPDAFAVINPKRDTDKPHLQDLSGAAVAYKLLTALGGDETFGLELATLGSVADMVTLRDENRVLVARGLRAMGAEPTPGIEALARVSKLDPQTITATRIAFQLAPRLNAAGRLGDGTVSFDLLMAHAQSEADELARRLNDTNKRRRDIESAIFEEALELAEHCGCADQPAIVLSKRGWHQGVLGIVAARIQNHFARPAILITVNDEGMGRGSGRGAEPYDLLSAIEQCGHHLVRYGGHTAAAGLAIEEEKVSAFTADFCAAIQAQTPKGEFVKSLDIDAVVSLSEICSALLTDISRLEPFGNGNPTPVFCSCGVSVVPDSFRVMAKHHIRFGVQQGAATFTAAGFNMAERFPDGLPARVDVAFSPELNTFRGETTIQLILKDVRV